MDTIFRIPEDMYDTSVVGSGKSVIIFNEDQLAFATIFEVYTPMDEYGRCRTIFPDPNITDFTMTSLSNLYRKWIDGQEDNYQKFFDTMIFRYQSAHILFTSENHKGYYHFPHLNDEIFTYKENDYTLSELAEFLADRLVIKG